MKAFIISLILLPLLFLVLLVIPFMSGQDVSNDCLPPAPPGLTPTGSVRVVQANIKTGMPRPRFEQDLTAAVSGHPDFVSLNEQARRTDRQITPAGYGLWRASKAERGDDGTAVLWRMDRWSPIVSGRVELVSSGPQKWDYDRGATWVRLNETASGGQASIISVHHMLNPRRVGPNKPLRRQLYRQGMRKLIALVTELSAYGPVWVAGDFNSQYTQNDPWGPRRMLGTIGMRSTMDDLGVQSTHDGGGVIDYIFYQPTVAAAEDQVVQSMNSDHKLLMAAFQLASATPSAVPVGQHSASPGPTGPAPTVPVPQAQPPEGVPTAQNAAVSAALAELNEDMLGNAQYIVNEAVKAGGLAAAVVAITTALTESGLRTDPGSLGGAYGVFQQTPSQGWGTYEQVMDIHYSTAKFLQALMQIPNWQAMEPWRAAQAVQRSGAGATTDGESNYGPMVDRAKLIVAGLVSGSVVLSDLGLGCKDDSVVPVGQGTGDFTPSSIPYVGPYSPAELADRMDAFIAANNTSDPNPFFHTVSSGSGWYNLCQHFVANLSGQSHSGYATANAGWAHFQATGAAHPADSADGMSPPVGAWLYYDTGAPAGHVAVYMGNNQVAGTDTWGTGTVNIGSASDLTGGIWDTTYLGWATPWGK